MSDNAAAEPDDIPAAEPVPEEAPAEEAPAEEEAPKQRRAGRQARAAAEGMPAQDALRIGEGGTPFVGIPRLRFHMAMTVGEPIWLVGAEAEALVARGMIVRVDP